MLKFILPAFMAIASLQAGIEVDSGKYLQKDAVLIVDYTGDLYIEIDYHVYYVPLIIHTDNCQRCQYEESDFDKLRLD